MALDINTIGPYRIMSFAKRFKRLQLFLHVSTGEILLRFYRNMFRSYLTKFTVMAAYVNGQRQGRVLEKPFCIGDTIARETIPAKFSENSMPLLDIETEIKLAFSSGNTTSDASSIQEMKDLGLTR